MSILPIFFLKPTKCKFLNNKESHVCVKHKVCVQRHVCAAACKCELDGEGREEEERRRARVREKGRGEKRERRKECRQAGKVQCRQVQAWQE